MTREAAMTSPFPLRTQMRPEPREHYWIRQAERWAVECAIEVVNTTYKMESPELRGRDLLMRIHARLRQREATLFNCNWYIAEPHQEPAEKKARKAR